MYDAARNFLAAAIEIESFGGRLSSTPPLLPLRLGIPAKISLDFGAEESVHACHDLTATTSVIAPRLVSWPGSGWWKLPAMGRRATMEAVMSKTQPTTAKLSDTQLVILSTAGKREDGSLLPLPETLTAKGVALSKVVDTLCKRKLVEERQVINSVPEWRHDEERGSLGLFITKSGLLALGVDETENTKPSQAAASVTRQRKTDAKSRTEARKASAAKPKGRSAPLQSKQDLVIQMLRRQSGVTIEDVMAKTGWQPHSVRGFFSGLVRKKLKLPLGSAVGKDGVRRYHIAPSAKA